MATYDRESGFQSILNAALGDYRAQGFRLHEQDDHTISLAHDGEQVAVFSQSGATIIAIHRECSSHIATHIRARNGIGRTHRRLHEDCIPHSCAEWYRAEDKEERRIELLAIFGNPATYPVAMPVVWKNTEN